MPIFGIIYGLAGVVSIVLGLRSGESARLLRSLGHVMLSLAVFNGCIEESKYRGAGAFAMASLVLVAGFLAAYTTLLIGLMRGPGMKDWRTAFLSSYLPVVYLSILGVTSAAPNMRTLEDPLLALYLFIILICVIHVPLFALGRRQALQVNGEPLESHAASTKRSFKPVCIALFALGTPLVIAFAIQVTSHRDERLIGSNAVLTMALISLVSLSRK